MVELVKACGIASRWYTDGILACDEEKCMECHQGMWEPCDSGSALRPVADVYIGGTTLLG